jgi:hypothetical protein
MRRNLAISLGFAVGQALSFGLDLGFGAVGTKPTVVAEKVLSPRDRFLMQRSPSRTRRGRNHRVVVRALWTRPRAGSSAPRGHAVYEHNRWL